MPLGGLLSAQIRSATLSRTRVPRPHAPIEGLHRAQGSEGHGTGRLIEGPFNSGDEVVVIEDVITTGGSALRAVVGISAAGGNCTWCIRPGGSRRRRTRGCRSWLPGILSSRSFVPADIVCTYGCVGGNDTSIVSTSPLWYQNGWNAKKGLMKWCALVQSRKRWNIPAAVVTCPEFTRGDHREHYARVGRSSAASCIPGD